MELRRKLPDYAKTQAEAILEEEVNQGRIYRHPPANSRSGPRFGELRRATAWRRQHRRATRHALEDSQ